MNSVLYRLKLCKTSCHGRHSALFHAGYSFVNYFWFGMTWCLFDALLIEAEINPTSSDPLEDRLSNTETNYFSFITSERGRDLILYKGYKYRLLRVEVSGAQMWRCTDNGCSTSLKYLQDRCTVIDMRGVHNHPPPDPRKLERQQISATAKRFAINARFERPVQEVVEEVLATEGVEIDKRDLARIRKTVLRARRQHTKRLSKDISDDLDATFISANLAPQIPVDLLEDSLVEFTIPLLDLTSSVSFITSNRGKELMLYGGYKFGLHRRLASGETSWSCSSRGCPARLRCTGDDFTVVKARVDHNHLPPKPEKLEKQKIYNVAKKRALEELSEQPRNVISAVLSEECVEEFTKDDVARVRRNLHRARRQHTKRLLKEFSDDLDATLSSASNPRSDDESFPEYN